MWKSALLAYYLTIVSKLALTVAIGCFLRLLFEVREEQQERVSANCLSTEMQKYLLCCGFWPVVCFSIVFTLVEEGC